MIKKLFLFCLLSSVILVQANTDLIIFSFDRAMQLSTLLESIDKHVTGLKKIYILCRFSNEAHKASYQELSKRFNHLKLEMIEQKGKKSFKPLLTQILSTTTPFILFAVDDDIVVRPIDLNKAIATMKHLISHGTPIRGFYFRLGKNIKKDFPSQPIPLPPLKSVAEDTFMWQFSKARGAWAYTNSLDMVLYRTQEILSEMLNLKFNTPNTLEGSWSTIKKNDHYGLCHSKSKMFNIPANLVQTDWKTPCLNHFDKELLLKKFNQNYKIDSDKIYNIINDCPHVDYRYKFERIVKFKNN